LIRIIENEEYKKRLNSWELIKKYFKWERVAEETVKIYKESI
jgi:glycosyltransferase involved in cell wall biosynthesis